MGGKIKGSKTSKLDKKTRKKNMVKADATYLLVGAIVLAGVFLGWRYYSSTEGGSGGGGAAARRPAGAIPQPAAL